MGSLNFNAGDVPPAVAFETLPIGDYVAIAESGDIKQTKNGQGEYLEFVFQIIEGQYKGRKVWERITWKNASEKSVQIGRAQLSALCRAAGVMNLNDTSELLNRPLTIKVGVEKRSDNGELANRIKGFIAAAGNVAGVVVAGSSKGTAVVTPQAPAPPWMTKAQ